MATGRSMDKIIHRMHMQHTQQSQSIGKECYYEEQHIMHQDLCMEENKTEGKKGEDKEKDERGKGNGESASRV